MEICKIYQYLDNIENFAILLLLLCAYRVYVNSINAKKLMQDVNFVPGKRLRSFRYVRVFHALIKHVKGDRQIILIDHREINTSVTTAGIFVLSENKIISKPSRKLSEMLPEFYNINYTSSTEVVCEYISETTYDNLYVFGPENTNDVELASNSLEKITSAVFEKKWRNIIGAMLPIIIGVIALIIALKIILQYLF